MDSVLSTEQLRLICNRTAREVTELTSGIQLSERDAPLSGEVCTLYTYFDKALHSGLAFCAEKGLFTRLAQRMLLTDQVDPQDVEDSSKEFFNILCGHIAVALFRDTRMAARFHFPAFYSGRYIPQDREEGWELQFLSDRNEGARLIHYNPPADGGEQEYK